MIECISLSVVKPSRGLGVTDRGRNDTHACLTVRGETPFPFRSSPNPSLNSNGSQVKTPPFPFSIGPIKEGIPHEGMFCRTVLFDLVSVDLYPGKHAKVRR